MKQKCFSVGFFFLLSFPAFAAVETSAKNDKPKVIVEEAKYADDQKRILVPAKVEAKIQATATADIEGHVVKIVKPLGAAVRAGDPILYLENRDPGFTYAKVPVRSLVNGVVSQLFVSQMSKVARGEKLFTVIDPSSLKIATEFSSLDVNLLKPGSEGVFKFAANDLKVRILGVSPLIDSRTGTASAELEFLSPQSPLPPIGTIGQVSFEFSQGKILMVPENSLLYQDGKPVLRIIKGQDQIEKKVIEIGEQREGLFVVKKGLQPGDRIVVRSSRPIKDGETIEIEKSESVKK